MHHMKNSDLTDEQFNNYMKLFDVCADYESIAGANDLQRAIKN